MNICESLTSTAKTAPDRVALIWDEQNFSYSELNQLSMAASSSIRAAGVQPGDRVALQLRNCPAFVVWYYAALRVGAIVVSVSTRLSESEFAYILNDSGASLYVGHDALPKDQSSVAIVVDLNGATKLDPYADCGQQCCEPHDATDHVAAKDDPGLILYTSGTTGFAKGATLSHGNVRSNVAAFNDFCRMQSSDRVLLAVPLFHCFGQNALLNSVFNVGGTIVLQDKFDPHVAKQLIAKHAVTQLYGVPMMFQLLHEATSPAELRSVEYCFTAAAKMPASVAEKWHRKFGMPIHEGYGLTETSPFASYNHRYNYVPGSIGTPITDVEMAIVDSESGEKLPIDTLGEIAIKGPNVMLGYWNRPEQTAEAIRDGWFHSGDIGRQDKDGYFYIVDRVKDMISVGGLKVYPAEVERVLLEHPLVFQAAVVGVGDEMFGQQVIAFVVPSDRGEAPSPTTDSSYDEELRDFLYGRLANFKTPRFIFSLDKLPRNPSGKVLKTELRDLAESLLENDENGASEKSPTGRTAVTESELKNRIGKAYESEREAIAVAFIQSQVSRLLKTDRLADATAKFLELGFDSLMLVELSTAVQVELGAEKLPPAVIFDYPRIRDLAEYIARVVTEENAQKNGQSESPLIKADGTSAEFPKAVRDIRSQIEQMSDEEALQELIKELE